MTLKEYFTKTDKYPVCMWDSFTPFVKTLVVIGILIWFIPAIIIGVTL